MIPKYVLWPFCIIYVFWNVICSGYYFGLFAANWNLEGIWRWGTRHIHQTICKERHSYGELVCLPHLFREISLLCCCFNNQANLILWWTFCGIVFITNECFLTTWRNSNIITLNKIISATLLFLPPFFMSWTPRSKTFSMYTKGLFLLNIVHKSV